MIAVYILSGLVIGTISGLIGIGGGAMMVPLFIFFFKMDIYKAVGTSLAVIGPIALAGALSHHLKGNVNLAPVLWIAAGAMAGMFVGGQIIHLFPAIVLRRAFAVFMIVIAAKLFMIR